MRWRFEVFLGAYDMWRQEGVGQVVSRLKRLGVLIDEVREGFIISLWRFIQVQRIFQQTCLVSRIFGEKFGLP